MNKTLTLVVLGLLLLSSSSYAIISHAGDLVTQRFYYYDYWNLSQSAYLYNSSGIVDVNETKLNLTISSLISQGSGRDSVNITSNFGGHASGTYDNLVIPMRNITGNFSVSGDMMANAYYGDGAYLAGINVSGDIFINGTNVSEIYVDVIGDTMTGNLVITDGTYNTTYSSTTISSNTYFSPLLQLGGDSVASASYAVAVGLQAVANATSAIALGNRARAYNTEGVSIGSGSIVQGYRAIALGYQASASGDQATAIGWAAWASGDESTAIGYQVQSTGTSSTALGSHSKANGAYSVSIGDSSDANGDHSFAFGDNVTVNGTQSYGFGQDGATITDNTFTLHNLDLYIEGEIVVNSNEDNVYNFTGTNSVIYGFDLGVYTCWNQTSGLTIQTKSPEDYDWENCKR